MASDEPISDNAQLILGLAAVTFLLIYLFYQYWKLLNSGPEGNFNHILAGKSMDASKLKPRMEELRKDYVRTLHPTQTGINSQQDLVAQARMRIEGLPYFQDRTEEHDDKPRAA